MSSSPEEIAAEMRGQMCRDCGGHLHSNETTTFCPDTGCEAFGKEVRPRTIGRPVAPPAIPREAALLNLIEGALRTYLRGPSRVRGYLDFSHVYDALYYTEELQRLRAGLPERGLVGLREAHGTEGDPDPFDPASVPDPEAVAQDISSGRFAKDALPPESAANDIRNALQMLGEPPELLFPADKAELAARLHSALAKLAAVES